MAEAASGTMGLIEHLALGFWEFSKRNIIPDLFIKRRFNFITIHYLYMMGMSLLGSVIIYGIGDIHYIDALFFASGASTISHHLLSNMKESSCTGLKIDVQGRSIKMELEQSSG